MTARTLLLAWAATAGATELRVTVAQVNGKPMPGAVVIAEPAQPVPRTRKLTAIMDQRNLMFVPQVLVIRTGSDVEFPNSDQVRHQVYSFSAPKKFQLSLYAGRPNAPVTFDKPGLVTVGCNIHDGMVGYIYVTDTPWFGRTGDDGSLRLDVPAGEYTITVQHPRITDNVAALRQSLGIGASAVTAEFNLQKPIRPGTHMHGADSKWEDY